MNCNPLIHIFLLNDRSGDPNLKPLQWEGEGRMPRVLMYTDILRMCYLYERIVCARVRRARCLVRAFVLDGRSVAGTPLRENQPLTQREHSPSPHTSTPSATPPRVRTVFCARRRTP